MSENLYGHWEKRWHPLKQEWVIYAAHRNSRPWTTSTQEVQKSPYPEYDPECYLCPGNKRIHGAVNPDYKDIFIFDNDHPVVGIEAPAIPKADQVSGKGLYKREKAAGIARVVCYDPRHNVTLADMGLDKVVKVFAAWRDQMRELAKVSQVKNILIFENKGELCGVSNPHPHGQIYAVDFTFRSIELQLGVARLYESEAGVNLFSQIITNELEDGRRVLDENEYAVGFVPFFARYAYETMIFPKNRHATLITMSDEELEGFAAVFHRVIQRYDRLFGFSFPYVMTLQQAPVKGGSFNDFQMHISILPPLRRPGLVKFLGGPESGCSNFMADTMPEDKAAELKAIKL